jgi:protein kinase-like protein
VARESGTALRGVGRYEILREVGRGGAATVYLARQTDLERCVALKELSALSASDPSAARRFVRESRLAASLNHPNIVTVHDFFEDHGTPYIAMEYLERGSLRPLMQDLAFAQIAGVLEGLLAGLANAHDRGVVHRDVKPENLLITNDGRVKIADFGIAKATGRAQSATALTAHGTTIGTPSYMAPEQALAEPVGPWTDLYAAGIIAFELLAGRLPFDTTGPPMAILLQHVNADPPLLRSVDPSADPRLSEWIDRLLVKEPGERTQTAGGAWMALEEIVLDRLGSRWRRAARLLEAAPAGATPATVPLARDDGTVERGIPTAMPRAATPPTVPAATAAPRDGRAARRLARALLLVVAVVAAVAAVAGSSGQGAGSSAGTPAASPSGSAAPAPPGRTTTTPPAATATPPAATTTTPPSGVGDSQSDDPSDDEPDGGEP